MSKISSSEYYNFMDPSIINASLGDTYNGNIDMGDFYLKTLYIKNKVSLKDISTEIKNSNGIYDFRGNSVNPLILLNDTSSFADDFFRADSISMLSSASQYIDEFKVDYDSSIITNDYLSLNIQDTTIANNILDSFSIYYYYPSFIWIGKTKANNTDNRFDCLGNQVMFSSTENEFDSDLRNGIKKEIGINFDALNGLESINGYSLYIALPVLGQSPQNYGISVRWKDSSNAMERYRVLPSFFNDVSNSVIIGMLPGDNTTYNKANAWAYTSNTLSENYAYIKLSNILDYFFKLSENPRIKYLSDLSATYTGNLFNKKYFVFRYPFGTDSNRNIKLGPDTSILINYTYKNTASVETVPLPDDFLNVTSVDEDFQWFKPTRFEDYTPIIEQMNYLGGSNASDTYYQTIKQYHTYYLFFTNMLNTFRIVFNVTYGASKYTTATIKGNRSNIVFEFNGEDYNIMSDILNLLDNTDSGSTITQKNNISYLRVFPDDFLAIILENPNNHTEGAIWQYKLDIHYEYKDEYLNNDNYKFNIKNTGNIIDTSFNYSFFKFTNSVVTTYFPPSAGLSPFNVLLPNLVFGCVISYNGNLLAGQLSDIVTKYIDYNNIPEQLSITSGLYMCTSNVYGDQAIYSNVGYKSAGGSEHIPNWNNFQYIDDASVYYYGSDLWSVYNLQELAINDSLVIRSTNQQPFFYLFAMTKTSISPKNNPMMNVELEDSGGTNTYYTIDFRDGDHASGSHTDYESYNYGGFGNYIGSDNINNNSDTVNIFGVSYNFVTSAPFRSWASEYQNPTWHAARRWLKLFYSTSHHDIAKLHISSCWFED